MRLSDKMTQTRRAVDQIYDELGQCITDGFNEMFEHGRELERTRIIALLEQYLADLQAVLDDMPDGVSLARMARAEMIGGVQGAIDYIKWDIKGENK